MLKLSIARLAVPLLFASCATSLIAADRKPGLWEYKTKTTWQKAPQAGNAHLGGEQTRQVCLTAEMIEQDGLLLPQSRGECSLENKQITPGQITADYVCRGRMNGSGALTSKWSDPDHVSGTLHFTGTLLVGSINQAIEWTTESQAEFKSSQCGSVRPVAPPSGHR